jgi:hypothetical protein
MHTWVEIWKKMKSLFPKSKFNWWSVPLLARYRAEYHQKVLDQQLVMQDHQAVQDILKHYCDCDWEGQPLRANKIRYGTSWLKLRDGRLIELSDIGDAIYDSAERQQVRLRTFLARAKPPLEHENAASRPD